MKTIEMYLKPACTTCRKAVSWFDEHGVAIERHDFAKEPPSAELLGRLIDERGLENVINPRGRTFKAMGLDVSKLSRKKAIELMLAEPNLIRRPLVIAGRTTIFGFDPEAYEALTRR